LLAWRIEEKYLGTPLRETEKNRGVENFAKLRDFKFQTLISQKRRKLNCYNQDSHIFY
jgi:hypothetical protein